MLNSKFHISIKNAQIKKIHCYFNLAATKRWYHVSEIFIGDLLVQEWLWKKQNLLLGKEDKERLCFTLAKNDEATI